MPPDPSPLGSIFAPSYLARIAAEAASDTAADAITEAEAVGPWTIEELPSKLWAVSAPGADAPELVTHEYETALLAAAVLPGTGRARLVRVLEKHQAEGYPLVSASGEPLGYLRHFKPELGQAIHVLEALRRVPLDFARFLHSTRAVSLVQAGRILALWEQAPPRAGA